MHAHVLDLLTQAVLVRDAAANALVAQAEIAVQAIGRRANAVAAALERLGVPRSDMVVAGRGMNDLRVPTPPGVREPQNRRVEIVFP